MKQDDYIVIDTEGKETLSEIAVINSEGNLIYQAYVEREENKDFRILRYPLNEIIQRFEQLAIGKRIICHSAEHDQKVLQRSYKQVRKAWPELKFECTYELARTLFPKLPQYSLEYLSKQFLIKVEGQWFSRGRAHVAEYDARFTHALYQWLGEYQMKQGITEQLKELPNPFSSSRVDTPYQEHPDLEKAYQGEYEILKSVLQDIKNDVNHQSRGAIVLGEAGTGKTHLMMRLAKNLLQTNGLLFIRQPNNASAILYHTYARILESFAQRVPETEHTQLEQLLARSFEQILRSIPDVATSQRGVEILTSLSNNGLNLYAQVNTQKRRESWEYIEKNINRWWTERNMAAGYSIEILKGIFKYCTYTDPRRKEMVRRWLSGSQLPEEEAAQLSGAENF